MKKIALVLALVLCMSFALSSCGMIKSGAEKAVTDFYEAMYVDFDKETVYDIYSACNKDIIGKIINKEDNEWLSENDLAKESKDDLGEEIEDMEKNAAKAKKYKVDFEIYDSRNVKKGTEEFDALLNIARDFGAESYAYTDTDKLEEVVEEFALVRSIGLITYTNSIDEVRLQSHYYEDLVVKIDGKWYVWGCTWADYGTHYDYDDDDNDISEWLS